MLTSAAFAYFHIALHMSQEPRIGKKDNGSPVATNNSLDCRKMIFHALFFSCPLNPFAS